ncbi:hypothetical protein GCM10009755_17470 [Brevibacterium samyangense]|uniref:Amino acid permease n=1 Tax=Brevibacterium samyangense TaxID=366888 RepID=A0ABN2TG17_9MICO
MATNMTTGSGPAGASDGPGLKKVLSPGLLLLFIVGDILGTGVYALTGQVAGQVGGAGWLPLVIAFVIALVTAFSYLELVTKYPKAAGAALYTHKAFGVHFFTFLVAFAVLCSGITSATTSARTFGTNLLVGISAEENAMNAMWIALGFLALIMLVNLRGVSESLWLNVVLTVIELTALLLVIGVGLWATLNGNADFSRTVVFETPEDKSIFLAITAATALGFFAMVGFEDSINMVEEAAGTPSARSACSSSACTSVCCSSSSSSTRRSSRRTDSRSSSTTRACGRPCSSVSSPAAPSAPCRSPSV